MIGLGSYEGNAVGMSLINTNFWPDPVKMFTPDPECSMLLVPEPPIGIVRKPLMAAIQCDGPVEIMVGQPQEPVWIHVPFVTCHGRIERTGHPFDQDFDVSALFPQSVLCWSMKLAPNVLKGGEFFLPVPACPIVHGMKVTANWSYTTEKFNIRTRSMWVDQPIAGFDWNSIQPLHMQPQQQTS